MGKLGRVTLRGGFVDEEIMDVHVLEVDDFSSV
jgi:hypothetical protein